MLRAKELARAKRARADEKIQRLERQLWSEADSEPETGDTSDASAEDGNARNSQQSHDAPRQAVGERFLDLLQGVGDGFPTSIRESAQEALRDGPQPDDDCRKGCNWIGGIRLAWTSPPAVREVNRHVQEHFARPIQPGDPLDKIDGKSVKGLSRQEILGLSIGFKREGNDKAMRDSAKDALEKGPQHDAESVRAKIGLGASFSLGHLLQWFEM